jgi:putative tryptophan/tyrosine transport system substrate-binding protein
MKRREFIAGLGSAAAWPMVARAQRSDKIYRIGFIANDPAIPTQPAGKAFLDGLDKSGFVEGKNVIIERRFAEGRPEHYADLAGELVNLRVDVIVSSSNEATAAVKRATNTIPVVMLNVNDPIGLGIITSLSHPGGNITGVVQDNSAEITTKRLQLLKDAVPQATKVAVLMNPDLLYAHAQWEQLERAARVLNTEAGGLLSYGSNRADRYRLAAIYVGKILRGSEPGNLPVEQATNYELIINLKTAKALGLTVPPSLLARADEVIE